MRSIPSRDCPSQGTSWPVSLFGCAVLAGASAVSCGAGVDRGEQPAGTVEEVSAPLSSVAIASQPEASASNSILIDIFRASPRTLASGVTPAGIAVSTDTVFWTGTEVVQPYVYNIGIFSMAMSGATTATELYNIPASNGQSPDSLVAAGRSLYWINPAQSASWAGLWTMPLTGGTATHIATIQDLSTQKQGVVVPLNGGTGPYYSLTIQVLVSDPSNSHLWSYTHSLLVNTSWTRTAIVDGTDIDPNHGLYYPDNMTFDASNVYFVSDQTFPLTPVYQRSFSGGAPVQISTGNAHSPIAVYASNVYFVSGNSIVTVPVGGGAQTTFATDSGEPTTFAVDGSTLYWTCTTCGTVSKLAFAGGAPTTLAANEQSPKYIAAGPSDVYWGASNAVRHRSK